MDDKNEQKTLMSGQNKTVISNNGGDYLSRLNRAAVAQSGGQNTLRENLEVATSLTPKPQKKNDSDAQSVFS